MTTDPHAMDLPADEPPPWPGWIGLRVAEWSPDKHDESEARADR